MTLLDHPLDSSGPRITLVDSPATVARPKRRHFGVLGGLLMAVVLPLSFAAWYLFSVASEQFASTVGFSVRKEEVASPIELFGGIADVASNGNSDSSILYEYIQSQEIVEVLEARIGLSGIYSKPANDPMFAYDPDGTIEDLQDYWRRMVQITHDSSTDLIEVRALAFEPEDARTVSTAVFEESSRLIDELSAIAQQDTITFAKAELERTVERLKSARQAMTSFRSRTQIVDPSANLQSQMGLLSMLEQQLAESLISSDLLRESTRETDPRIKQADRRIAVIEARIRDERRKLGVGGTEGEGDDYATHLAEYERLAVDREFAEQSYIAGLAAYDQALAEARRKSRYLAAFIHPTLAEASEYPRKWVLLGMGAFGLLSLWGIAVLVFYSFRDRR